MANTKCKECGCVCPKCTLDHDVHLHVEIENLKTQLVEKHNTIVTMETNFLNESNKYPNGELLALHDELLIWQDKYKRLYDAHRRIQRVNQGLEDKLLRLVDITETDKSTLTKDVATLSYKLAEANYSIKKLTEDNERYKNDVSVAIQFLQCKPGNFVSQKFDTLPNEVQAKVSSYMGGKRKTDEKKTPHEIKSIKVPIPTFPPTAMVYSVPKSQLHATTIEERDAEGGVDIVSAAIMAKVLEERARERACVKHCDTCTCSNQLKIIHNTSQHSIATQTSNSQNGTHDSLCLQCNTKIERPTIQIVKGVNSSEAHSKNKNIAIPVYIHESSTTNVAKVQPNNFLINDANDCSKLRKEAVNSTNKLGSVRVKPIAPITEQQVSDDLIDLGTPPTVTNGSEMIYFANERSHKKSHKVRTHEHQRHHGKPINTCMQTTQSVVQTQPLLHNEVQLLHTQHSHHKVQPKEGQQLLLTQCHDQNNCLLLDSADNEVQQVLLSSSLAVVPDRKPSSLSSGDHSEMTSSELIPSSASNHQRVEEWMDSMNLTETATVGSGTECSESLISLHNGRMETELKGEHRAGLGAVPVDIDTHKYKEMEDNVKKFLLGEYTILNDVKNSNY